MKTKSLAASQRSLPQTQTPLSPVEPPLSPQLGFVVQFRFRTGQSAKYFAGRVEHLVSGRSAHFHSPKELMAFLTLELGTEKEDAGSGNTDFPTA